MKVAVVYNRQSKRVINLFGMPNQEKYGLQAIKRITDSLKKGGHLVKAFEGDKDLIDNLEHFMPRVLKGEIPGMVFNLSYGIQGQARYTHVPSILEMVGIPYVGSGPLAHSLCLDKVVTKMLLQQHGIPTPEFAVLQNPDFDIPDLDYPLIVKPKNEAVSFGIRIVNNDDELRDASLAIFEKFQQPVLAERYIEGAEINVGLLGNNPPETFAPVQLIFGEGGPNIYTFEDKKRKSGREITTQCPAPIGPELTQKAHEIARNAFEVLGCFDCARADMRMDDKGNLYILEINSLPSLGEHGSYLIGAEHAGLDFAAVINRLVEVASARYFGTPSPTPITPSDKTPQTAIFSFLTQRRDRIEERLKRWIPLSSRTFDAVGIRGAAREMGLVFNDLKMKPVEALTDDPSVWTWETRAGLANGTLLIGHLDVPMAESVHFQSFRREPEHLHGEGIAASRGPLVMLEYVLRALQSARILSKKPIGVMLYADEGHDCLYSADLIGKAAKQAARVLVLRPRIQRDSVITERRGQRTYRLIAEGSHRRIDKHIAKLDAFRWASAKLSECSALSLAEKRLSIAAVDFHTSSFPLFLPHRVTAKILMTYSATKTANEVEAQMREILSGNGFKVELELISDRPPLSRRRINTQLANELALIAEPWEIPLQKQSSVLPSAAGLVPSSIPVVCGIGPVSHDLYTPRESISRISLLQRTLLLAQYLAGKD